MRASDTPAGLGARRQRSGDDRTSNDAAGGVTVPWRTDLFDDPADPPEDRGCAKPRDARSPRRPSSTAARMITPQAAAEILDASDDFRVLRRLRPRAISEPRPLAPGEKLATGALPSFRLGGKLIRIKPEDVERHERDHGRP